MIEGIRSLVQDTCWFATKRKAKLKDTQSKMTVNLKETPRNGIVVNFPCKENPHSIMIKEEIDYKKFCDSLIFVSDENSVDVYLIEMKKSFDCNLEEEFERACKQIIGTIPIVDYLFSMVKTHSDNKQKIKNIFFVILAYRRDNKLNKQRVTEKNPQTHSYGDKDFKVIFLPPDMPPDIKFCSLK